ncbi:hypothetical protein [uncultured Gammaproteobacteria bacterium]|nr:hypothetical protein [uncultured Gammaproteobacteria bacterium]CAC9606134.1 hypothetical protein [uncultured Gammaproteobacteria bacterium]
MIHKLQIIQNTKFILFNLIIFYVKYIVFYWKNLANLMNEWFSEQTLSTQVDF